MEINNYINQTEKLNAPGSWFSVSQIIMKLRSCFSLVPLQMSEIQKKLRSLCDKDSLWPEGISYADRKRFEEESEKDDRAYLHAYRKYMHNTIEDIIASACVSIFELMRKNKKTLDPISCEDDMRDTSFSEVFAGKTNYDICSFLIYKIKTIVAKQKDVLIKRKSLDLRYRPEDFKEILEFLFSFAVKLGVKNLEWYIQKRINFELLRQVERLKKSKKSHK
jgi:hypothetical protein